MYQSALRLSTSASFSESVQTFLPFWDCSGTSLFSRLISGHCVFVFVCDFGCQKGIQHVGVCLFTNASKMDPITKKRPKRSC